MAFFDFLKKKKNDDENIVENEVVDTDSLEEASESEEISDKSMEEETKESVEEAVEEEFEAVEEKAAEALIEDVQNEADEEMADIQEIAEETVEAEAQEETSEENSKGFFAKIKQGLEKTRNNIMSGVENVLKAFTTIDEELYEELEEALIMADIGVDTSLTIIEKLREKVKSEKIKEVSQVKEALVEIITEILVADKEDFNLTSPAVILVIGVNGVGKTTTIGKLANNYKNQGKSVMLAAADTFRAAAIDQLQIWGERNNVPVIRHEENSDPAAVVFDAVQSAKAKKADLLICDTAGRLHNKKNLMEELKKIAKIINREYPQAQVETLLVLDSTTGQNALQQAKLFKEAADITGLVLTKLDGTAKGGIVIAIKNELKIPVRFIGVGEGIDDLQVFDENDFARALFEA